MTHQRPPDHSSRVGHHDRGLRERAIDFLWQVVKAAADARITQAGATAELGTEEAVRQARLRTLLPIFRNILLVVIVIFSGLTALSSLGVDIGPLIAGAGCSG